MLTTELNFYLIALSICAWTSLRLGLPGCKSDSMAVKAKTI